MKLYATVRGKKYQDGVFIPVEKSQGSNDDMRIIVRDEKGEWFIQLYITNDDGLIVVDAETGDGEVKRLVEKQTKGEKQKGD